MVIQPSMSLVNFDQNLLQFPFWSSGENTKQLFFVFFHESTFKYVLKRIQTTKSPKYHVIVTNLQQTALYQNYRNIRRLQLVLRRYNHKTQRTERCSYYTVILKLGGPNGDHQSYNICYILFIHIIQVWGQESPYIYFIYLFIYILYYYIIYIYIYILNLI